MKAKTILIWLLAVAAIVHIGAVVGVFLFQGKILFHPDPTPVGEPDDPRISLVSFDVPQLGEILAFSAEAAEGCPTVLFFHGNASYIARNQGRYDAMLDKGVGFLAVAWPGYAGSDGKPGEKNFHRTAAAAEEKLLSDGVPASDIVIHGFSIGTGPSTKLASQSEVGALVLEAPYLSLKDLVDVRDGPTPFHMMLTTTFRSDEWIGDVTEPVLMVHGDDDRVIPLDQSLQLYERANMPKTYVAIEGGGHSDLTARGLYDVVWTFLQPIYPDCNLSPSDEVTPT